MPKVEKENDSYKVNPKEKTEQKIPLNKIVLPTTFAKIDKYLILDPTKREEKFADVIFTISRSEEGIHGVQKSKYGYLTKEEIEKMLEVSKKKFEELKRVVEEAKEKFNL